MTKGLLEKYLNNCCTSQEVEEVIHWMNQQTFFTESRKLGRIDWQQFKDEDHQVSDEKLETLLDKIHHKLNIEEPRALQIKSNRLISWISKAAAIIIIPVLAFLFHIMSENDKLINQIANVSVDSLEVIAPVGSRTVVELSDGSVVHLNYGSQIKYPQNFLGETRSVVFTGEGYFDVAHNPEKPFVVKTGKLNIKALGTAFNVLAYPDDNFIETTLVNGKVVLEQKDTLGKTKSIGTMVPGQHVHYNINTGDILSTSSNVEKYIAWKDGKLVFEDTPIFQIAERLSRMFNVDIKVSDDVKDYFYTVTFVDEPLFQILDLMTLATPVSYKTLPRKKLPDGTFSKQKIIIEKRN